jgi:membrane-associated protein
MNLENAVAQILALTSTLDPRMAALLFVICAIGEFGISIPYVLESVWLLVGYQLGAGVLSPLHLAVLWLAAQCGRQVGATALYHMGRLGSTPIVRFYNNKRLSRFIPKAVANSRVLNHINLSSPFSVAFGRLFGMRIPLTLTSAVKKRQRTLLMGVLLSSLVWDTIYISVGLTVGATAVVKPVYMFSYSLAGLTLIYLITFLVRRLIKRPQPASDSVSHSPTLATEDKNV